MPTPIIYTTPVLPWPADQGSKRFLLESGRALQRLGPVHWVTRCIGDQSDALSRLRSEGFTVHLDHSFERQDPASRVLRRIGIDWTARRRGVPREQVFVATGIVRRHVARLAHELPQALGVAAYWTAAGVLEDIPRGRRVLLAADVESHAAIEARRLGDGTVDPSRVERLRRAERRAFAGCDLLLCLTAQDCERADQLMASLDPRGARPALGVWPASIPVPDEPLSPAPPGEASRLLCYGHWDAPFNRDGLRWFLEEIWPTLRERSERPVLRVVGRNAGQFAPAPTGVEIVGWVEDLRSELETCHAVVVPLRWAGGLRYRLLEAMAAARPVLCTPVAASGAGSSAGRHHLEATSVAEWSSALDLLDDPRRRDELGRAAHRWVRDHYSPDHVHTRLRAALSPVLHGI